MNIFSRTIFVISLVSLPAITCFADENELANNWNNFRGPSGNGISTTAKPPANWSPNKNVAWKVAIPGRGSSSPVVWGNKIFLTTAVNDNSDDAPPPTRRNRRSNVLQIQKFMVMCLDRSTGETIWEDVASKRKPTSGHHQDHGYASASPATDGEHVYFSFGSNGLYCYDLDGKQVWKRTDLGEMNTRGGFGEGSSVALFNDVLVLPWDHEGQSSIETINKKTGKTIWKKDRNEPSSWATPQVVTIDGKPQIIHAGENFTMGYDLKTGEEIWRSAGLSTRPVATPVAKGNIGYFASSRRGSALNAYYLDKEGDISSEVAWKIDRQTPDCPSLLLSENRLFYVSGNRGIVSCANSDDGSMFFDATRLAGIKGVYSSPVAADGKVFITGRGGKTAVIADDSEFELIGQNDIGERVDATLALVGSQILVRGSKHLFCIQEKTE